MTVSVRTAINPPILGFDATKEYTSAEFALGTKVECSDGTVWRFVSQAAAKTTKLAYQINEDWAVGDGITTASFGAKAGVPLSTTDAATTHFWIQTAGEMSVEVLGAVADGSDVYTSATAGKLDDAVDVAAIVGAQFTSATAGAGQATIDTPVELTVMPALA